MNFIKKLFFVALLLSCTNVFAKGGDDVGNGGFAYKQSVIILKMATTALEDKIRDSNFGELIKYPERRMILQDTLGYDDLDKFSKKNQSRGGRKLALNYIVNPATVIILKPYFEAFMGKTDTELEDASLQVQKLLLHEAAHTWGYKEDDAEKFAIAFLEASRGESTRPTKDIKIKGYCSCLNGKSDSANLCDSFCATKPATTTPILYVDTLIGELTAAHPKLGNLYNWCTRQLSNDQTSPACVLRAYVENNNYTDLPINLNQESNSFSANIATLPIGQSIKLKVIEVKTGSGAETAEFTIKRKSTLPHDDLGLLAVSPINQYTCMTFGGKVDSAGNIIRTTYSRMYYYYQNDSTPAPIEPVGGINQSLIVCHDEMAYPGNDSALYQRLELIKNSATLWDMAEPRFMKNSNGELIINEIIKTRLLEEYGLASYVSLFTYMSYQNRPSTNSNPAKNLPLGFVMIPFSNSYGKSYCPTSEDFTGGQPLMTLLGDYMTDTEGLFIGEGNGEVVQDGSTYKTFYATMFVREAILKNYGFYLQDGLPVKAGSDDFHKRTIYYYWPVSPYVDPTVSNGRRLFTVKRPSELNGQVPTGQPNVMTSDKRIGCIPKN